MYLLWSMTIAGINTVRIDRDTLSHHDEYCSLSDITNYGLSTECCGSCILDPKCKLHGSCCLNEYRTFEEATTATDSSRYEYEKLPTHAIYTDFLNSNNSTLEKC